MTMEPEKQRLTMLARRLTRATSARTARWQLGDDGVYVWTAKEGSVTVVSRDRDDDPPYELSVLTPNREKIDELSSALLEDDRPAPWNEALVELYRAARRSALGADDIIDALIEALAEELGGDGEGGRQHSLLTRARRYSAGEDEPS
jgi:hypothetical protein